MIAERFSRRRMQKLLIMLDFAVALSSLSQCDKRGVAAIITDDDFTQVYSIGINGGPKGGANCLCGEGPYSCVHAEANALAKCTATDPNKVAILTLSPCVTCAALMANSGIKEVYYLEEWKDTDGLKLLGSLGICVRDMSHLREESNRWT